MTDEEHDRIDAQLMVMRAIVARLLVHEARRYENPNDLFEDVSEGNRIFDIPRSISSVSNTIADAC